MLRKKQIVPRRVESLILQFPLFSLRGLSKELPDYSDSDVLILHQLDFISDVAGVSFSFDNIFLNEVEDMFCKTSTITYYPIWIVPFFASIFHFRVADPSFNNSGANQWNDPLIPSV